MGKLEGVRVLVVEGHALLAMAQCDRLHDRGARAVGLAARLAEAEALASEPDFDIAILDVHLGGEQSYPLARSLRARGIPVIFMAGYDYWALLSMPGSAARRQ